MTETKVYEGELFRVTLETDNEDGYFELRAFDRITERHSAITNLNFILSAIIDPILNPLNDPEFEIEDTWLYVTDPDQHQLLVSLAVTLLTHSPKFWTALEAALAEDFAFMTDADGVDVCDEEDVEWVV